MWWNKYLSIPFKEKGRDETGCDCWGILRLIKMNEQNIIVPSYLDCYETTNDRESLSDTINSEKTISWKEVKEENPFNVLLIRMRGVPMHVGIITQKGWMIHTCRGIGTSHERYDCARWKDKIMGIYAHE